MSDEEVRFSDLAAEIPDAGTLGLIGDIMAHNARTTAWGFEQAYEGEKHSHEQTKRRLDDALDQLYRMRRRMEWVMGSSAPLLPEDVYTEDWEK